MPKQTHHLPKIPRVFLQLIAKSLVIARKTKHMRQSDLAERAGISRQTLARLEKGDPNIAIGIYLTVSWILDIPLIPGLVSDKLESQNMPAQILHFLHQQLPQRVSIKKMKNINDKF